MAAFFPWHVHWNSSLFRFCLNVILIILAACQVLVRKQICSREHFFHISNNNLRPCGAAWCMACGLWEESGISEQADQDQARLSIIDGVCAVCMCLSCAHRAVYWAVASKRQLAVYCALRWYLPDASLASPVRLSDMLLWMGEVKLRVGTAVINYNSTSKQQQKQQRLSCMLNSTCHLWIHCMIH